jgi:hypothetical protein
MGSDYFFLATSVTFAAFLQTFVGNMIAKIINESKQIFF